MGHYREKSITTQNYEEFGILCLKTGIQNTEIKPSNVQTHNFDASFLFSKPTKLEMEQSSSKATHVT